VSRRLGQEKEEGNNMAESLDARRMAKEQEERMAASVDFGFKAAKPFVQFQTSMMRLFAENMEQAARNYEKSFEAVSNIAAHSRREAA
jgi:hypothetical protein